MAVVSPTNLNMKSTNPNYIVYTRDKKTTIDKFYADAFEIIRKSLSNFGDQVKSRSVEENWNLVLDWFSELGSELNSSIQKKKDELLDYLKDSMFNHFISGQTFTQEPFESEENSISNIAIEGSQEKLQDPLLVYQKIIRKNDDNFYNSKSHQIESILRSGADFLNGHYDAILLWYDESNEPHSAVWSPSDDKTLVKDEHEWEQHILTTYGFTIRLTNIEIPAKQNDSFQLKTANYVVEKIKSIKTISKQANFRFRLDQNLEWLRFFNDLSGNKVTISHSKEKNFDLTDTWQNRIGFFPKSFYIGNNTTSKRVCLAVSSDMFETLNDGINTTKREKFQYVFEDVKFLGSSDFDYDSSSSEPTEITVDFIFKRLRKVSL